MGHRLLDIGHIDVSHRLMAGTNNNKIAPIIVKFNTRTNRDTYYSHRAALKNITIADLQLAETPVTQRMLNNIYINESISVVTKLLFRQAREHIKAINTGGFIHVKKDMEAPRIRINCEDDLANLS